MPLQAIKPSYKMTMRAAQTRVFQASMQPAPVMGLDVSFPLTDQDPRTAIILDNYIARRFGVEMRGGSIRWTTNLGGVPPTSAQVVSLMAYNPPRGTGSTFTPKLFAACDDGNIYDVTDQTDEATVPAVAVAVPGQLEPGRFSWTNFSTANTNYLCICSAGGGYWTYDDAGGWVDETASITPGSVPASSFDFVMAWKNRLWFIANNTTEAYYLTTNAIIGSASLFDFGPLFVHGGDLRAMASWTVDGGDGVDDKLVMVSSTGDVLIYQGTDPAAAATFSIVGRWYVGRVPEGRRFMSKYGGDLALITERGIEYMSRLLQASGLLDPETQPQTTARRFNEIIGEDVRDTAGATFWQLVHIVSQGGVVLLTPHNELFSGYQYFFSTMPQAWSRLRGWDAVCGEEFEGDLYYGTDRGTVHKAFSGTSDDQLSDDTPGTDVYYDLQTAFTPPNNQRVELKRPQLVQPTFVAAVPPRIRVSINTEWSLQPVPGSPPFSPDDVALWDNALWDSGVWDGDANVYIPWIGVEGLGSYVSLRMLARGAPGSLFTGWKLLYEAGGPM